MRLYLCTLLLLVGLFACNQPFIINSYQPIPDYTWQTNQRLSFEVDIDAPNTIKPIYFQMRNNEDYLYANLWIGVNIIKPDGTLDSLRYNCPLADGTGKWLGSGPKTIYDNRFLVYEGYNFTQKGTYKITIEQIMRKDAIEGIVEAGVRVGKL
jgi:gliding motility-associated lipoprotein GldH